MTVWLLIDWIGYPDANGTMVARCQCHYGNLSSEGMQINGPKRSA